MSILVFPVVVSCIISMYLLKALSITQARYSVRTTIITLIMLAIWVFLLILDERNIRKKGKTFIGTISGIHCMVLLVLSCVLGVYLVHTVWNSGYLKIAPFEAIDNGMAQLDSVFHASIAESYKRSVLPRVLINNEQILNYHTFSHLLLGLFAKVVDMPGFVVYCYFYPILFIPIYILGQFFAIVSAKRYFGVSDKIGYWDLIIIVLFNTGIFSNSLLNLYGVWKSSYIVSESFLVANTLLFRKVESAGDIFIYCNVFFGSGNK